MFSKQFLSTLCLVIASVIWGTAFVAQTTGMEFIGPLTFTNMRFLIGGVIVLPFALKEISLIKKVTNKKKLLLNLKYIFPNKDYELIKSKLDKNKFFWFEKKITEILPHKMLIYFDGKIFKLEQN